MLKCKERILYLAIFLFFTISMVLNNFKEWMDFLMVGLAIHSFLNPYFYDNKKDISRGENK